MNNDLMQMQVELNIEKKWDAEILKIYSRIWCWLKKF